MSFQQGEEEPEFGFVEDGYSCWMHKLPMWFKEFAMQRENLINREGEGEEPDRTRERRMEEKRYKKRVPEMT